MNRERNVRMAFREITGITHWTVYESATLSSALKILGNHPVEVLLCGDADWRGMRGEIEMRCDAPGLIVCAEKPDVALWADVLHRGGYGVLPLPLVRDEALRTCWLASMSRQSAIETAPRPPAIATRRGRYARAMAASAAA